MEITLNHTIVPSYDRVESAKWYEAIFGFEFVKEWGPFAVLKVNSTLTLDFSTTNEKIHSNHYAFKVNEDQFDLILARVRDNNIKYGSGNSRTT